MLCPRHTSASKVKIDNAAGWLRHKSAILNGGLTVDNFWLAGAIRSVLTREKYEVEDSYA